MIAQSTRIGRQRLIFSLRRQPNGIHRKQLGPQYRRMINRMLAPIEKILHLAVEQGELSSLPSEYSFCSGNPSLRSAI